MVTSHADTLCDFVRQIDSALNKSPDEVCIARLCTPEFLKRVTSPLLWISHLHELPLGEARVFLDHDPASDAESLYIIAEQRIGFYLAQYETVLHGADALLWDIAAATVWKRVQAYMDVHRASAEEILLTVPELERILGMFCTLPIGSSIFAAAGSYYAMHLQAHGNVYGAAARQRFPSDLERQKQYVHWLCLEDTEAKTVSSSATFVRRECGEDKALDFLVRVRDVRQGKK